MESGHDETLFLKDYEKNKLSGMDMANASKGIQCGGKIIGFYCICKGLYPIM